MQKILFQSLLVLLVASLGVRAQKKAKVAKPVEKAATITAMPAANNLRNEEAKLTAHGVTLAGTFTLPATTAPRKAPAVLLLGAFDATPRDGMVVAPNVVAPIYKAIAEHLATQGFVTFRFDKRCAGASSCPATAASMDEMLDDAKAALDALQKRPEVNPAKTFIFGHSEGGQFAASLAAGDPKLAGVIMAASPGRTLNKILREYHVNRMREAKEPAEKIAEFTAKFDLFTRILSTGDAAQMTLPLDAKDPNDAMMQSLAKQPSYTAPMFINDPLQTAQAITIPVLLLQGDKDWHITVKDGGFLSEAFTRTNHPDTTYKLFPNVNHLLQDQTAPATTNLAASAKQPVSAAVFAAIDAWLAKRK